jgi:hypothetical protein
MKSKGRNSPFISHKVGREKPKKFLHYSHTKLFRFLEISNQKIGKNLKSYVWEVQTNFLGFYDFNQP